MFLIDRILLLLGVLLLLGILSSKFSARLGLPVLVLFLLVGMLAGEEGIGRIPYDDVSGAHAVGTLALAMILFDGGMSTTLASVRSVWKPASLLATLGVLITSIVTGVAAAHILEVPPLEGVLLGSIVGSTDAAAVFALLRNAGVSLDRKLQATLEIESGSNDPMAIFLTVGLLEVVLGRMDLGAELLILLIEQMGIGAMVGLAVGWGAARATNRIRLDSAGLYPVLSFGCGLLAFGAAANLGGSGFLAIYVAGIVLGNTRITFRRGTLLFHSGLAWMGQIAMFVTLGLLVTPTKLFEVAGEGLGISAVLIFVARPVAVVPMLVPFGFSWREIALISWVGLKGAVPIILAIFPLLYGLPDGPLFFNVVFFVVIVSAITQGWSLAVVARKLGLEKEPEPKAAVALEITSLRDVDADIIEYTLYESSPAAGCKLREITLPEGVVVAMIARESTLIPPRGSSQLCAGDHVFVVMRGEMRPLVDRVFRRATPRYLKALPPIEFLLRGSTTAGELHRAYGVDLGVRPEVTIDQALRERLDGEPREGASASIGGLNVRVEEMAGERIATVALCTLSANDVD